MALVSGAVTIGTTPTAIYTAVGRTQLTVSPGAGGNVWLGDNAVTTGSGIFPPAPLQFDLSDGDTLYGIAGPGGPVVSFIAAN